MYNVAQAIRWGLPEERPIRGDESILSTDGRLRGFSEVGRLPAPGDNVAIATGKLEAGTEVERDGLCGSPSSTRSWRGTASPWSPSLRGRICSRGACRSGGLSRT